MGRSHDQRCTPFTQNVEMLWYEIKHWGRIGHKFKNIFVELWRRARGKCI